MQTLIKEREKKLERATKKQQAQACEEEERKQMGVPT